jgi:Methyltransferase domain
MQRVFRRIRLVLRDLRPVLMDAHMELLRRIRIQPFPLSYWLLIRSVAALTFRVPNALLGTAGVHPLAGSTLPVPTLRKLLENDQLGVMTLDADTIVFLWEELLSERPRTIVECGSGISTLVLARYAAERIEAGDAVPRIVSLEQDAEVKAHVDKLLIERGLHGKVQVIHAPLTSDGTYSISSDSLARALGCERIDWILIDGPAGADEVRRDTICVLGPSCKAGTRWFLDDAFRDGELNVLRTWNSVGGTAVRGIYPVGKGLATGSIVDPTLVGAL